ncbi:MAG TPA: tetratricopeptide repeat protein [Holophagaceae bacterium]|jgi:tetratricopeptide (TPR) repeat protein|nr:tetratricopeptide repeat protein [Holophagaceae bacterium]
MPTDATGTYCQNCLAWNSGDRETCVKCGTRLLILRGDQAWEEEPEEADGEDLEEHLLERITGLEETVRRVETYLETVSDQLGKLERAEIMLRNGLMALVQEMEQHRQLDAKAFSERWEALVEENLHLIGARELFTRYRARILPIARPKSMAQLRRALNETMAFLEEGQLAEAADRLALAVQQDPKNYELIFTAAALLEAAQRFEDAEGLARKVVQLSPRHFEGWMLLARLLWELPDQVDEAIESLETAAEIHPEDAEPHLMLAELLQEQDDLQGALDAALAAVKRRRDGETLLRLGRVRLARGEGTEAVPVLKDASAHQPGDLPTRECLAEAYLAMGERAKAFAILHELLDQNPGDPDLLLLLDAEDQPQLRAAREGKPSTKHFLDEAEHCLDEGLLDEAETLLKRAKRKGASQRLDWLELRLAFRKDPAGALQDALKFSRSDRHPRLCFLALRLALERLIDDGRQDEVQTAIDAFLARHPKSTGAWEAALMRLANRLSSGNPTETDLAEARRLHQQPLPGFQARARALLGQYLLAMGHPGEVVDLVDPVLEREPTLLNHFQLGAALASLGEKTDASDLLRGGLEADPGDLSESQAKEVRNQMKALLKDLDASQDNS